jgi:predicted small lipoprotein YifL
MKRKSKILTTVFAMLLCIALASSLAACGLLGGGDDDKADEGAPSAPQSFTVTAGDKQVSLTWAAPSDDGGSEVTGYEVSKDNGSNYAAASSNTSHTFTGLTNGTEYTFKVRAINANGKGAATDGKKATPTASSVDTNALTSSDWFSTIDGAYGFEFTLPDGCDFAFSAGKKGAGWNYNSDIEVTFATQAADFVAAKDAFLDDIFDITGNVTDGNYNRNSSGFDVKTGEYTERSQTLQAELWYFNTDTRSVQIATYVNATAKTVRVVMMKLGTGVSITPNGTPAGSYTGDMTGTGWPMVVISVKMPDITIPAFTAGTLSWDTYFAKDIYITVTGAQTSDFDTYGTTLTGAGWTKRNNQYYKNGILITIESSSNRITIYNCNY